MGGKASREKGKRGEREWARLCREHGFDAHRTAQYRGNTGAAGDVEGLPGFHCEVKRTEKLLPWTYMEQSIHDSREAGKGEIPIVAWRRNDYPWLVYMAAEDFFKIATPYMLEVEDGEKEKKDF